MNEVQVEKKTYQMPPKDGISIGHFITEGLNPEARRQQSDRRI